ncbi:polyprenyl synthetase family protein [Streptomyces sp. ET3-23]|uniref:polyprenyl synthetase family protein n=1 Tax=Streptomyces sp. ET3-23 TaxID=2885643 RepID=UPI001D1235EC|nr:polyprenyl synthetase family protein [Streptomyces sp. ET3-23]MCC2280701.1 polyprenyl synthetase family protein [Streptomyces sp. ET3-23]
MTAQRLAARQVSFAAVRERVDAALTEFLESKAHEAAARNHPAEVTEVLHDFVFAGGKRLRPVLCVLGWMAADGRGASAAVVQAAASLEMFHAFCLIHDDVMDRSTTRRGSPTVHRALTTRHHDHPAPEQLGTSAAILAGDLALVWSDELLATARLTRTQLAAVRPLLDTMRTEVMYGQYLDLLATGQPTADTSTALEIIRYKTAKYTIERPLHIGATLASARQDLLTALSAYALPLGEAFQLRDDLLGVFGDTAVTGKPVTDDLREGKHTLLTALALQHATPAQQTLLHSLIGHPGLNEAQARRIRTILETTGARRQVEDLIDQHRRSALHLLDTTTLIAPQAITHLHRLAHTMTRRTT